MKRFSAYHENLKLYLPLKYLIARFGKNKSSDILRVTLKISASGFFKISSFVDFSFRFVKENIFPDPLVCLFLCICASFFFFPFPHLRVKCVGEFIFIESSGTRKKRAQRKCVRLKTKEKKNCFTGELFPHENSIWALWNVRVRVSSEEKFSLPSKIARNFRKSLVVEWMAQDQLISYQNVNNKTLTHTERNSTNPSRRLNIPNVVDKRPGKTLELDKSTRAKTSWKVS